MTWKNKKRSKLHKSTIEYFKKHPFYFLYGCLLCIFYVIPMMLHESWKLRKFRNQKIEYKSGDKQ